MADATIEIRNLSKRFGKVIALDQVNLSIQQGEFVVLLGPSGCGKSTLLRALAGLEWPDEGEIVIRGKTVFSSRRGISVPPGERDLGMVFQSYALWPHMKVEDNVGFGLQIKNVPRAEVTQRVERVLRDLAMEGLESRYPSELSGGQQQRVAVARLLATSPPVFLMDEPLSNLDARLRMDMRTDLKRLHEESHATTVFVTHDQAEAMSLATQIAVMNEGRIEQVAEPRHLYKRPANLFVADFIGVPRINLLPAQVHRQDGGTMLEVHDFTIPLSWTPAEERVTIAAKPEDLRIYLEQTPNAVEFQIAALHPTGPDLFVRLTRKNVTVVARETGEIELKTGQTVWVTFDTEAINLYGSSDDRLLSLESERPEAIEKKALRG